MKPSTSKTLANLAIVALFVLAVGTLFYGVVDAAGPAIDQANAQVRR